MSNQNITVTRALSELNTIKKRLAKLTVSTTFLSTKVAGRAWRDHVHETQRNHQAMEDLMERYIQLKFAIITSNATTRVTIGKETFTVAEAIAFKECLQHKRSLLDRMRNQRLDTDRVVQTHNDSVRAKLDRILEITFKSEKKHDPEEIKTVSDVYLKNNTIEVVDPLGLDKRIVKLDEEIDNFAKEVDFVLSESNALTRLNLGREDPVLVNTRREEAQRGD